MNNLFLKVAHIDGESRDADHQHWIDIHSYSWGVRRTQAGRGGANHQNLTVHAKMDKSTPTIFLYSSNGNKVSKIELSACMASGTQIEYQRITLENVFIAAVVIDDNGISDGITYEFQADSVKLQYWEKNTSGGKGAETRSGWDIKNNTSSF